ncbi:MAG: protease inhibitor Inh/omp19 family protein [Cohaesibacter sp.]|nr:protease inhibitor Inh/omp19 family protein [Cohaesibacter sp.]
MSKSVNAFWGILASLVLSGCSLGGVMDDSVVQTGQNAGSLSPVMQAALPPIDESAAEKFSQKASKGPQELTIADKDLEDLGSESQAFASQGAITQVSMQSGAVNQKLLGQWELRTRRVNPAADLVRRASAKLFNHKGDEACLLNLEKDLTEGGFKASGVPSCPTAFFMLESWRYGNGKLVLKNHMGDEIVSMTNRDGALWVGVDGKGETFLMEKVR